MKAANLSYERSMLDLSVKPAAAAPKGKKTTFEKAAPRQANTRMKKKVNTEGQRAKQQRKPFY